MSRYVISLALLSCLSVAAAAQAPAKKGTLGCFSKAEQAAERIIREGLRLREGARGCDEPPWNMRTASLWADIDQKLGARFLAQSKVREKAFLREFKDDADNRLARWNARTVFHFRYFPLSEVYCANLKKTLQQMQKKGWGAVSNLAAKGTDEVEMDYRPCG